MKDQRRRELTKQARHRSAERLIKQIEMADESSSGDVVELPVSGKMYEIQPSGAWVRVFSGTPDHTAR